MIWKGEYLGTLALGVTPNKKALATAALTREITVAVFISIWVLVIIGAVFNALTITRPIRELVIGVREIAKGNFKSRVDLPMSGELGELLNGFNAMASKLEDYDAANIEELKAAQVKQQSLIATMADGALLLDEQGKIVLVNPTARRLFRWEGAAVDAAPDHGKATAAGCSHNKVSRRKALRGLLRATTPRGRLPATARGAAHGRLPLRSRLRYAGHCR